MQISDTHLFEHQQDELLGINTLHSFHAVLDLISENHLDMDALFMTGDVSQDHTPTSYLRFEEAIAELDTDAPCYWLPGNHDDKANMINQTLCSRIKQDTHVLLNDKWQAILLDSQVYSVPHGRLSDEQLSFLDKTLSEFTQHHAIVLMHHHPLLAGSDWLDNHCLKNLDAFWEIIDKYKHVKLVVCGHIHQEMHKEHNGVSVLSVPSTCVQFKPNNDDFSVDHQTPGFRVFELAEDGSFESHVERLPQGSFLPDLFSKGY